MNDRNVSASRGWAWFGGVAAGLTTQGLFLYTVWRLFWFLRDGPSESLLGSLGWDVLLALQFAVVHSLLLWPPARRRLTRWIPAAFYGLFFCTATCLGLLLMFSAWQVSDSLLWELQGVAGAVVSVGFYGSWAALFYSLSLTGLGYQTGLTPWWHWVHGAPQPRREFRPRGAYCWMRHPVYLSFLGLIWFTPRMTLDHAILTGLWTVYIAIGSHLKDERLAKYVGQPYLAYQAQVPGYPLISLGPLGRRAPNS